MTPERWQELKNLLNAALELPPRERNGFLAQARVDGELRREVEALLALETRVGDFIETPAVEVHRGAGSGDRTGQRVGPWELVEEIGRGGMGTVYRARRADDVYDQTVALKVLKRGLDTDEVVRRFRAERQILAGLEHPHIARLLDGGTTDDGLPYLVMEYVDGLPIDVYCREAGLPVEQRLGLFLQVCSAVQLAHRNLVVHRDLKPSNILVTADGVPKLLDFGIAKLLDPAQGEGLMTVAGWQFLTPEYASPEQAAGGAVTTATDVYSLGVLLYQLLADRRPYELVERSLDGLTRVLAAGGPPRPSSVAPPDRAPRLRGDLDDIAGMALRPEPERRYATVDQLADDIHRHLDGRPVRATPDTLGYRLGKFIRRNKLPVAAAAAFLALVVGFSIVTWVFAQQAVANERLAEENAAEAEANAQRATTVTDFLKDSIAEIDPDNSQGDEPLLRDFIDWMRERLAEHETLQSEPREKADLLQTIARAYISLGWFEEAQEVVLEALELQEQYFGHEEDALELSETQNLLAKTLFEEREFDQAEGFLNRVLDIQLRHRGPKEKQVLQTETNLATIYEKQGRRDEAEALYLRLIDDWRAHGDQQELAVALNNLAALYYNQGRYAKAELLLEEALSVRRRFVETDSSDLASTLVTYGATLQNLDRLVEAERALREAVEIQDIIYSPANPRAIQGLWSLARVLHQLGQYPESEETFQRALDLTKEDSYRRAVLLRDLASLEIDAGKLEAAESHIGDALEYWERDPRSAAAMQATAVLGGLRAAQGRREESESLLLTAFWHFQDDPEISPDHAGFQDVRRRLVALYENWGRPEEAARYRRPVGEDAGRELVPAAAP